MPSRTARRAAAAILASVSIAAGALTAGAIARSEPAPAPVPRVIAAVPLAPKPPVPRVAPVAKPAAAPAPAPLVVRSILPIEGPMKFGSYVWDDSRGRSGELVITVDLKAQVLSAFRDGHEIGAAVILYGSDEKPTPLGVHRVTQKKVHHVSNLYDAEMPYMMRLTDDGVAIHASDVKVGYATHGCIGVPLAFAKKLFAATPKGTRVIVTNGETLALGDAIKA